MAITITLHTTVYGPWQTDDTGDSYRDQIDSSTSEHVITDEDMRDALADGDTLAAYVASILTDGRGSGCYAVYASSYPRVNERTWYSDQGYEHPATGQMTETTYHLDGPEWTYALARDVAAIACWSA